MNSLIRFTRRASMVSMLAIALVGTAVSAEDTSFTIAVIPDTQNYMDYTHQKAEKFAFDANQMFFEQMRYVAANLESEGGDIAFVTSLGDNWQHQTLKIDPEHQKRGFKAAPNPIFDTHFAPSDKVRTVEMPAARKGWELLMGKVPFSVVPGNHDYDAMWTDSRFPPSAKPDPADTSTIGMLHLGGLNNFRSVFGSETPFFKGQPWYVSSHDGGADSAQIFSAGGYRFLHIGLQFSAPDASLEWAASVIKAYAGLPTIITTHDYMDNNAQRLPNPIIDAHKADRKDNSPEMLWQKFISQHDQIFLVLCGHEHGQAFRTDANRFGHPVYQVLSDYQSRGQTAKDAGVHTAWPVEIGDGWLRMMTFDMATSTPTVKVRTYSTHYKKGSTETPEYASWYRNKEQPRMTDAEFQAADDFTINLTDFRSRFKKIPSINGQ